MKNLVVLIMLFCLPVHGQTENESLKLRTKEFMLIYTKNADPYLKAFAENHIPPSERGRKEATQLVKATHLLYQTKLGFIEAICSDQISKLVAKRPELSGSQQDRYLLSSIDGQFEEIFPGLTYEFYEKVHKEIGLNPMERY